ncbi:DUF2938 domain-containing protein [Achromobacter seleniivolatilans]|uniref:DUF2938 domain-containing protein n=1 Tax=Achromobacter seleniivolatilans TaxID=3047478 RepID=A0ABY9M4J8_9BURK|nr:DUF2938 domain-containing protein [Achromobacter sp. R39]WMD21630.1 DUF2938 domain-containing protein [Achromobacter sp. R39]
MTTWEVTARIVLMGAGATMVMDAWAMLMKQLGVPTLNWAFVGRWVGHLFHGKFAHERIGQSRPIPGELALGWFTHYAVGIAFAALLAGIQGMVWLNAPTLLPALTIGIATVAVPLFVMQPAMGAGFASAKTPTPIKNCLRSVATHAVFGLGLYLSAAVIARV